MMDLKVNTVSTFIDASGETVGCNGRQKQITEFEKDRDVFARGILGDAFIGPAGIVIRSIRVMWFANWRPQNRIQGY